MKAGLLGFFACAFALALAAEAFWDGNNWTAMLFLFLFMVFALGSSILVWERDRGRHQLRKFMIDNPDFEVGVGDGWGRCDRAPEGWWCSRPQGHAGPCAARPAFKNVDKERK